jgi:hypothetical protein
MGPQCVFGEAVDMMGRFEVETPEYTQSVQTIHHLMTGGPAESPAAARAEVRRLCETLLGLVSDREAKGPKSKAAEKAEEKSDAKGHEKDDKPGLHVHPESAPARGH